MNRRILERRARAFALDKHHDLGVTDVCPAWVATKTERIPLLFAAREPHVLAVVGERMMLVRIPKRRPTFDEGDVVVDLPFDALGLQAVRRRWFLQLLVRTKSTNPAMPTVHLSEDSLLAIELRRRDHPVGRKLAAALDQADA